MGPGAAEGAECPWWQEVAEEMGDGQAPRARRAWGTQSVSRRADSCLPDSGESAGHAPGHVACEILRDPWRAVSMVVGMCAGERWGQHRVATHPRGWILQSRVRLREIQAQSRAPCKVPQGLSSAEGKERGTDQQLPPPTPSVPGGWGAGFGQGRSRAGPAQRVGRGSLARGGRGRAGLGRTLLPLARVSRVDDGIRDD